VIWALVAGLAGLACFYSYRIGYRVGRRARFNGLRAAGQVPVAEIRGRLMGVVPAARARVVSR